MHQPLATLGPAWGAERVVETLQVLSCEVSSLPYRGELGEASRLDARPAPRCFENVPTIQPNDREALTNLRSLSERAHQRRSR